MFVGWEVLAADSNNLGRAVYSDLTCDAGQWFRGIGCLDDSYPSDVGVDVWFLLVPKPEYRRAFGRFYPLLLSCDGSPEESARQFSPRAVKWIADGSVLNVRSVRNIYQRECLAAGKADDDPLGKCPNNRYDGDRQRTDYESGNGQFTCHKGRMAEHALSARARDRRGLGRS